MPIQDAPDGTVWITHVQVVGDIPVPEVPAHEETITRLDRKLITSAEYQAVVSWEVDEDKVGVLRSVEMESNNYNVATFRLTIANKEQFSEAQFLAPLDLQWPDVKLAAESQVLLEAKSDGETEIIIDGIILGKEVG